MRKRTTFISILVLVVLLAGFLATGFYCQKQLAEAYNLRNCRAFLDRNGEIIFSQPNSQGHWRKLAEELPPQFKKLLIQKEDKYFYYHFGFNPWSILQAALSYTGLGKRKASSTISQQLVKILLGQEFERNLKNKIVESFYTLALETYSSKDEILKMYANSVYFGNRAEGIVEASQLYFNLPPDLLSRAQILQLLATISSPAEQNPSQYKNKEIALSLAEKLGQKQSEANFIEAETVRKNMKNYSHYSPAYFEMAQLVKNSGSQQLTIDRNLTEKIREIVFRNLLKLKTKRANNAAVIVLKLPENEILAQVGSPDPESSEETYQINMLSRPRPIGSTVKPFIYLNAFEKGLRPYSLVEDREYKYQIGTGFSLYPKNYDYQYRGPVTLHYALSNSLNVPTVKVLEYVSLDDFYEFLEDDLEFKPIQNLENYQLGIALGELEMSLMDLAKYFTIFPNQGVLKELKIEKGGNSSEKFIEEEKYIQLVNKILSDRNTGIDQFGLKSNLNLSQSNYALKTGTSREFHDSWIIGYTPDFLVGVWLGNAENTPMTAVSGQQGAGLIWSEVMELLFNSKYNKKTLFKFDLIKEFYQGGKVEYGLPGDNYQKVRGNLLEEGLILNPHSNDVFLLEKNTKIILKARKETTWLVNEKLLDQGKEIIFQPQKGGTYQIKAVTPEGLSETLTIYIRESED